LALVFAFLASNPLGFQITFGLLGVAFGVALLAIHIALWRAPVANGTVIAMRWALLALLVTVSLGLLLAGFFGWGWRVSVAAMTDLHAVWGLARLGGVAGGRGGLSGGADVPDDPAVSVRWFVRGFARIDGRDC
jgi:hypothetical protein